MKKLSDFVVNKRIVILAVMLAVTAVCEALIPKVVVNTDMTKYLPDDSSMKIGLDVMEREFPDVKVTQTVRVMFRGLGAEQRTEALKALEQIPYVDSVDYDADSGTYNEGEYALFVAHTVYGYGSAEERSIESQIRADFAEFDMDLVNGDTATAEIPLWIVALAFAILLTILFAMCNSWVEPLLFLIAIGCAIVINLGTNYFKGEVSNVTFSIAAILQMVLSMDYSIMLMNRYRQELAVDAEATGAMKRALTNAFSSIASSSVTTIVGLLCLVFMRFKIGSDLGIVLAKGVFISLLCIFTILPGLILLSGKAIKKTAKKELRIPTAGLAAFSYRARYAFAALFAVLFIGSFIMQGSTKMAYTLLTNDPIADIFPPVNTMVLLYGNADDRAVTAIAEALEDDPAVKSAVNYSNTLGKEYGASELADALTDMDDADIGVDIDATMLHILYYDHYRNGELPSIAAGDFLRFLADDVLANENFAEYVDDDIRDNAGQLLKFADADALTAPMAAPELAAFFDMDLEQVNGLYMLYAGMRSDAGGQGLSVQQFVDFVVGDVLTNADFAAGFDAGASEDLRAAQTLISAVVGGSEYSASEMTILLGGLSDDLDGNMIELMYLYYAGLRDSDPAWTLSIRTLFDFLSSDIVGDPRFDAVLGDAFRANIDDMKADLDEGVSQLKGENYSRLIITATLPDESDETTVFLSKLIAEADADTAGEYYLIGSSAMNYEMQQRFGGEMTLITLLTAISIFLVVLVTFRNAIIPALLVLLVQCGVYITVSVIGLQGYGIYYLALLIVQSILMGATIDYGILFTDYYRERRQSMDIKAALVSAYSGSIHTILTSGLIMVLVTGIVGFCFEDPVVGQICRTIAIGALSAILLILLVLPGMLATFDRGVAGNRRKRKTE